MKRHAYWILSAFLLVTFLGLAAPRPAEAGAHLSSPNQDELPTETPSPSAPTPAEVITAVNNLRISHGLPALNTNSILMQVAAQQASALAASEGSIGHERPCGMTLGQDLLSRGYPLLGDLSMDGYRSENWVTASTTQDAITFWLSDDAHTNTMLSPNRNDIGAAVAVSNQIYVVLETAWSTASGKMQYDAYPILTSIPQAQAACLGMATEAAANGVLSQYSFPVSVSTPLPNGDVVHEVKYGQSLWSIAIQYKTTIAELKRLNHLNSDTISTGQKLLVRTEVTQATPAAPGPTSQAAAHDYEFAVTPVAHVQFTPTAAPADASMLNSDFFKENGLVIAALVISFAVLLAGLGVLGRRR